MSGAKLTLGFSPCPNDCFIFDALVHKKIDTEGLEFEPVMEDVETLNKKAFSQNIDITKLSYHAYVYLINEYQLLNSGSALGFGVGPLLIGKVQHTPEDITGLRIAIPGKYTTANFLLSLAFPEAKNKTEMKFSEIEDAVLSGKTHAGVIIHENRFTYMQKGLKKLLDLGEWWEKETGTPIPLGGIAVKRTIAQETKQKIDRIVRKSVEFAFANPASSKSFVRANAQEMDETVMQKHIDLYVNKFSVELGTQGQNAVKTLFERARKAGIIKNTAQNIFL